MLSPEELEERVAFYRHHPQAPVPRREDPERAQQTLQHLRTWRSPRLDLPVQPQFTVGSTVRARNVHPAGHTRLPRYVRGKQGVVERLYGIYDIQDAMPAGQERPPQPLYAVRFQAQELWGDAAEANHVLYIDMWEHYLEPA